MLTNHAAKSCAVPRYNSAGGSEKLLSDIS